MSFSRGRKQPAPLDETALYEYAVGALARRMRAIAELKQLMRRKVEQGESGESKIATVVARLKEHGYINDSQYAANYARLRQENEKFGKRRVQQELYLKGVHPDLIGRTLEAAYEGVDEEQLVRAHLERKRVKPPATEKDAARVVRLLARAGFSTGAIFKVLKNWTVSDDALSAIEQLPPQEVDDSDDSDRNEGTD